MEINWKSWIIKEHVNKFGKSEKIDDLSLRWIKNKCKERKI
jgi:hypothetical protein